MCSAISWEQYFTVILTGSLLYYFIVVLKYYRNDLPFIFSRLLQTNSRQSGLAMSKVPTAAQTSVLSNSVDELTAGVSLLLNKAKEQGYPKEELMMALRIMLRSYHTIRGTKFQDIITAHIQSESQLRCNMLLDAHELAQLW